MALQYLIANGHIQTTAAFVKVTTGNTIKTMMQLQAGTANVFRVIEWGCSFDASAAATPGQIELIETSVAATVTAYAAADITKYNADALLGGDPTSSSNMITVGTGASGFTSTSEGSVTTLRNLAGPQLISPTNQDIIQLPLGREALVQNGSFMRIRVTFGTAVNMYCYVVIEI
jgi:hypothetical protein